MTGARIDVRLIPRAARSEIVGFEGEVLRVRVTAPPVDGRANAALIELLATMLGVRKADVRIVAGQTSRQKVIAVDGLATDEVRRRIGGVEGLAR